MNDPLDAVFVYGDEAAELKRIDIARKLATYLERMPAELRRLFGEQFQRISFSDLMQLRADRAQLLDDISALQDKLRADSADLQAAQARIAEFESGALVEALLEANRDQSDIIIEQAQQINNARRIIQHLLLCDQSENCFIRTIASQDWLAANPDPAERQP